MSKVTLQDVLNTFMKHGKNGAKRRFILDKSPLGGMSATTMKLILLALPLMLALAIFNPYSFQALGVAQANIFFIVFLSMLMAAGGGIAYLHNSSVAHAAQEHWKTYFDSIELHTVLNSGNSPFKEFFWRYNQAYLEDNTKENLQETLNNIFETIVSENREIIEKMAKK